MVLRLRRAAPVAPREQKASAAGPVIAFQAAGRPVWTPKDAASLTRSGFMGNAVGFRCVKVVSEAAAAIPLTVSEGGVRYDTHPVLDLLAQPNPAQSGPALLEAFFGQILLSGDGYLEAAGFDMEACPRELHVLRSDRMRVIPGPDGWPLAFEYTVGGKKVRFDMKAELAPVMHLRAFHPQNDHYGMSPLEPASAAVDVHNAATRWSKSLLDNAARPSGAIVYRGSDGGGTLQADQYSRLVEELELNHQGARNAGRPMLLEGGLDWKPMGFSPSDMEFHRTKEAAAREIALAFGVPPMILGLPGDNTYANYQEANRAFYRLTVLPLVNRLVASMSGWLSRFWGVPLKIAPDLDAVPALSVERDALWKRISQADFLNDAEKRQLLGLARAEDGSDAPA
ncbi:MAG: phage portal protein [Pseudomonadota bacterium]